MLPDFGKYDVPVGGNLIPAPSFQANGVESPGNWQIWNIVERWFPDLAEYGPRLAMSTVLFAERNRSKERA